MELAHRLRDAPTSQPDQRPASCILPQPPIRKRSAFSFTAEKGEGGMMPKHFIGTEIAKQVGPNNLVEMICRDGANTSETSQSNIILLSNVDQRKLDDKHMLMMHYFLKAISDDQIKIV